MIETEVKLKVSNLHEIIKKIQDSGAVLEKERHLEKNTLYDFPSQLLYKKRSALRLRRIGNKSFLAFKGPPQKSRKFKVRVEYETEVKNEKIMRKILKSLGFIPLFNYQKFRRIYRKKNLKICLDELSLGYFLEIEGERSDIVRFAKSLGFSKKEFIKKDYVQLLLENKKQEMRLD